MCRLGYSMQASLNPAAPSPGSPAPEVDIKLHDSSLAIL